MATKMESFSFEAGDTEDPAIEVIPSPQFEEDPEEFAEKPSRTSVMAGCGLLVWALAGPFLALLAAIGGAYAAERNKGPFGESCKTVGHIAGAIAEFRRFGIIDRDGEAASSGLTTTTGSSYLYGISTYWEKRARSGCGYIAR